MVMNKFNVSLKFLWQCQKSRLPFMKITQSLRLLPSINFHPLPFHLFCRIFALRGSQVTWPEASRIDKYFFQNNPRFQNPESQRMLPRF